MWLPQAPALESGKQCGQRDKPQELNQTGTRKTGAAAGGQVAD